MENKEKTLLPPHLGQAIVILAIFICFLPILQMSIAILLQQDWLHQNVSFVYIGEIFSNKIIPALLPAYAQFLPASLLAGGWLAFLKMRRKNISFLNAVLVTLISSLLQELFIDFIMFLLGVNFQLSWIIMMLWRIIIIAILSGAICWKLCGLFIKTK